ncbi:BatD family protein [Mucilaginibacter lappiensis]|uniref:Oxygen tolerance n=1 Tax=Mucilaginibacter lappiensis TaxID=354630 RepID=A0A841JIM3_9SPHI|nr:BatD family protein [Mucilaginibacter lappiensis]MBB6130344.1 hypothetical protein [Mucilaginibacter lappiensis]
MLYVIRFMFDVVRYMLYVIRLAFEATAVIGFQRTTSNIQRITYRLSILSVLLTGFAFQSSAQNVEVGARIDRKAIKIGEQTQLHITARMHVKDQVDFPVLADSIANKILIVSGKADTVVDKSDASIETIGHHYTITAFDSGEYVIPSYAFHTASGEVKTEPLKLIVATVAVDTTKAAYDIKQPLIVQYTFLDWLMDHLTLVIIIEAVILIGGILFVIYYVRKKNKKEVVVEEPKPLVPIHLLALQKLTELRNRKLWQQEQTKQYHTELTDIIRDYLENRYVIKAHEQTSDEIFTSLRYMDITEENRNALRQVLILADLVKFAKEKPLPQDNEQSMDNAVAFVNRTQQAIQPPIVKQEDNK